MKGDVLFIAQLFELNRVENSYAFLSPRQLFRVIEPIPVCTVYIFFCCEVII